MKGNREKENDGLRLSLTTGILGTCTAVLALALGLAAIAEAVSGNSIVWWQIAVAPVALFMAVRAESVSRQTLQYTRRVLTSRPLKGAALHEHLEDHTYVLYLRAFGRDKELGTTQPVRGVWNWTLALAGLASVDSQRTWEERIVLPFLRLGRVISVGEPGERLPRLGAARFYLSHDNWRATVSEAIRRSRLVVMVASISPDESAEGTLWEYTEAVRLLPAEQLVLIVLDDPDGYDRFRRLTAAYADRRAPELASQGERLPPVPTLPDHREITRTTTRPARSARRSRRAPLIGAIVFGAGREPEFAPLTGSAHAVARLSPRLAVRRAVRGFIARLELRLPGRAVRPWGVPRQLRWMFLVLSLWLPYTDFIRKGRHGSPGTKAVFIALPLLLFYGYVKARLESGEQELDHGVRILPPDVAPAAPPDKRESRSAPQTESTRSYVHRQWSLWFYGMTALAAFTPLGAAHYGTLMWLWACPVLVALGVYWFRVTLRRTTAYRRRPRTPEDIYTEESVLLLHPGTGLPGWDEPAHRAVEKWFPGYGEFVAVGPADDPAPGSRWARLGLPADDTRPMVSAALVHAWLVIAVAVPGAENIWRFCEAVRLRNPPHVLLLVTGDAEQYRRFAAEATAEFRRRAGRFPRRGPQVRGFPRLPDLPRTAPAADGSQLSAVIRFTKGWGTQLHTFDPPLLFTEARSFRSRQRVWNELHPHMDKLRVRM
ncbi:hypothetical protein ACIPW9_11260 [Streptomyces sp. NPDC090052]|uniref:hypothetical protein n=1 Tax=Streptomyces sp. NPDC090052 TaxID=3365931 RepID=UPI003800AD73